MSHFGPRNSPTQFRGVKNCSSQKTHLSGLAGLSQARKLTLLAWRPSPSQKTHFPGLRFWGGLRLPSKYGVEGSLDFKVQCRGFPPILSTAPWGALGGPGCSRCSQRVFCQIDVQLQGVRRFQCLTRGCAPLPWGSEGVCKGVCVPLSNQKTDLSGLAGLSQARKLTYLVWAGGGWLCQARKLTHLV